MRFVSPLLLVLPLLAACAGSTGGSGATTGDEQDQTGTTKLLDCNVFLSGGGPDQQVTVLKKGNDLVLRELTDHGSMEDRPLSAAEWASQNLRLRSDEYGSKSRLYKDEGGWNYESKSDGWNASGNADCWVDKSPK